MLSDVTIGQYLPGDSPIHKLDPRAKIVISLLLMISIFLCRNYISLGICIALAFGICFASKIKPKVILKGIKPIIVIVIFTTVINLFTVRVNRSLNSAFLKSQNRVFITQYLWD